MDSAAFRSRLREKHKTLLVAYLFSGEQDLLKAEALEELRRAVGGAQGAVRSFFGGGTEAGQVLEARQNLSLLEPVAVVVVRQAARLSKADAEELAAALPTFKEGPPLVLWDQAFDKRVKLFAEIARAGGEVEFTTPKRDALAAWIRGEAQRLGHRIGTDAVAQLLELVGEDLLALRSTLERLSVALGAGAAIDADAVLEHVASSRLHAIYELQGAMLERRTVRAVSLLRRLIDEGEELPALVGALFAEVRRLLIAREASGQNLARLLEVHPYRAEKIAEAARRFSSARLRRAIEGLADIDVASKTGRGDAQAALEAWLIELCEADRPHGMSHVARR